jgi:hypothetical protein
VQYDGGMSAVTAKYPEKHREYIKAANQGK